MRWGRGIYISDMKIRVNGRELDVRSGMVLSQLLKELDIETRGIAVEIDREIVPKSQYGNYVLREGNRIEIVQMVGGG